MAVSMLGATFGVPSEILPLVQSRALERVFHEALFPNLMFRADALPELWPVNVGERQIMTRTGLIPVKTRPLIPGNDPVPSTYASEQWEAVASQYADSIDTHMPTSYVSISNLYLENTKKLGQNAGETLNRLVRDRIYNAYLGGETNLTAAASAGATQVRVASINGFTENLRGGEILPIGPANTVAISFTTVGEPENTVVGAVPDSLLSPLGPGTLFLGAALTNNQLVRAGARAKTRSRVLRVGGGATVDSITAGSILTMQDLTNAVATLRANRVPTFPDGKYHVHLPVMAEAQLFNDNAFQRLYQSIPSSTAYRDFIVTDLLGCYFYRDTETPNPDNVGVLTDTSGGAGSARSGEEIYADVINQAGVPIQRTVVMGAGSIYEKYLDESRFITDAGVTGKVGSFQVTSNGLQVMTDRIRYIARSPLDALQQVYRQTWSWSGDFVVPSDLMSNSSGARYKRAVVIEHA